MTSAARLLAEFRAALHYGPGPHPDGTPQSVHAGGANPAAPPPRREWLRVKFFWPTYDPTEAFSPTNPDPLHVEGKSLDGGRAWTPLKGKGDIEAVRDWMMLNGLSVTSYELIGQKKIAGRWHGLFSVVIGERAAKSAQVAAARLLAEFRAALHYGPGPHGSGSPQSVHGGGANPAAKPPKGQMGFDFDKPAQDEPPAPRVDPLAGVPEFRTIAEANAWAVENHLAHRCDLKGLTPQTAREVLATVKRMQDTYGGTWSQQVHQPGYSNSRQGSMGLYPIPNISTSGRGRCAARASGLELTINPSVLEKQRGASSQEHTEWVKNNEEFLTSVRKSQSEAAPGDKARQRKYADWIKEAEEALAHKRFHVMPQGREIEAIITHEMGHTISDQMVGLINPAGRSWDDSQRRSAWDKLYVETRRAGVWHDVSAYAATSTSEGFAEAFTMYHLEPDALPPVLRQGVEDLIGAPHAK